MKTTIHCDERITNIRNSIYVKLFWGIIILDTLAYLLDYFFQTSLNGWVIPLAPCVLIIWMSIKGVLFNGTQHFPQMDLNDAVERAITECIQEGIAIGSLKGDGYHIAQGISSRMKKELGITVSVGVSFHKIFAKLRGIGIRTIGDLARTEELAKLKSNTSNPDSLHSFMLCSLVNAIVVVFQKVCS